MVKFLRLFKAQCELVFLHTVHWFILNIYIFFTLIVGCEVSPSLPLLLSLTSFYFLPSLSSSLPCLLLLLTLYLTVFITSSIFLWHFITLLERGRGEINVIKHPEPS